MQTVFITENVLKRYMHYYNSTNISDDSQSETGEDSL